MRLDTHVLQDGGKVAAGYDAGDVDVDVVECSPPPSVVVVGIVPGIGVPNGKAK